MNKEIVTMVIELIKQGGVTAVWAIVIINATSLLKVLISWGSILFIISQVMGAVKKGIESEKKDGK